MPASECLFMDASLPDPADWLATPLAALSDVDSLLRCQICKDYYTSAVVTNCAHTFCSVCIRRCLSVESRCPTCNTPEQESRLRRNGILQEVVDTFVSRRPELLKAAQQGRVSSAGQHVPPPSKKRKRQEQSIAGDEPPSRRTRSQNSATGQKYSPNVNGTSQMIVADSDEDYTPESSAQTASKSQPEPADGLVACPSCSKRMKEEYVFAHLDNCTGERETRPSRQQPISKPSTSPAPQRLPQLSYNLLKDNALKKKLEDLKIPAFGPRSLLIRRHSEWLAIWNANCDSSRPRGKPELLRELDAWERSQGGRSANAGASGEGIKGKEFEPEAYNRAHGSEFSDLIAQARASRAKKQAQPAVTSTEPDGDDSTPAQTTTPSDPAYDLTTIQRRGSTAPPATGPLKVSESLHSDTLPAPALPTLAHAHTEPGPQPSAPARPPARLSRPITTHYSPSNSPTSGAPTPSPHRRPSLSQATVLDPPAPATMMWSGSHEARTRGTGRTMHMFQMPGEPVLDSEFEIGSK